MKDSHHREFALAMVACAALLSSCATTTMQSVDVDPDFDSGKLHKVLVISLQQDPSLRQVIEKEFVRQWKKRGVEPVAASEALSSDIIADKTTVFTVARTQGFDAVLVTRLLDRKNIDREVHVRPLSGDKSATWEDPNKLSEHLQVVVASPEYDVNYEVAVVSTNLYNVATGDVIWSGITDTLITGEIPKLVPPYVRIILKKIYEPH